MYLLSWLPLWVLYGLSSLLYVVLYGLLGYRKKVVRQNLANALPERSEKERLRIERAFYRYLCDLLVETVKLFSMPAKELNRRFSFTGFEQMKACLAANKPVFIVLGHYGNWEWAGSAYALQGPQEPLVIYKEQRSKRADRLIFKLRARFGAKPVEMGQILRQLIRLKGQPSVTAFLADQAGPPESSYWTTFLHQPTAVFWGTEKLARKFGAAVFFTHLKRPKRGYYHIDFKLLTDTPSEYKLGELSELHTQALEAQIKQRPELWLWSHKRWKHKQPEGILVSAAE